METLARCFSVLEHLGTGKQATHAELMRDLGIARSTLSDMLSDLRGLGMVTRRGRHYMAGPRLISFVVRVGRGLTGPGELRAVLADLAEATGETAAFVLPVPGSDDGPDQVVAIDQVESRHELRYIADIGRMFPALPRVAGRVLIACAPGMTEALPADERQRIRARGYEVNQNDARGASKAALMAMTRTIAVEYGALGIRANMIAPGRIMTELGDRGRESAEDSAQRARVVPIPRLGLPADCAGLVVYLLSDASSYQTGTVIPVDGGLSIALR